MIGRVGTPGLLEIASNSYKFRVAMEFEGIQSPLDIIKH
jgi:hypothetical protein